MNKFSLGICKKTYWEGIMNKFAIVLLLSLVVLLGCSLPEQEPEITQNEKVLQMLAKMEEDFFIDSVEFDEENRKFLVVSDYHVRVVSFAKKGQDLELRNGNTISWDEYMKHIVNSFFNGGGEGSLFSFGIQSFLGEGYSVKEKTSEGEVIFIAKDGALIYDIINGYAY